MATLPVPEKQNKVWLSSDQKQAIGIILLQGCNENGKPKRGLFLKISEKYGICRHTVRRLWEKTKIQLSEQGSMNLIGNLAGNVGRKKSVLDVNRVAVIPLHQRTTVRALADKLKVTKSQMQRRVKEGAVRQHSNAIKPSLKDVNKKERVRFCLSMVDALFTSTDPKFINFHDFVHVDEKWFYLTKQAQNYYLTPEELDPERSCKSKRFIPKVMFLTAMAQPRTDAITGIEFDGKIGLWPFVFQESAKRSSKNRPAGTLETKSMNSVTKLAYRAFLVEKLLPALIEKWPLSDRGKIIYTQQDNAKPHISTNDPEFEYAASTSGLGVKLVCQPANSPDMNVLDLGFFCSIEALLQKARLTNINELIAEVEKAFFELPIKSLSYVLLTLQECMIEVLKTQGKNHYKIPHMNKARLDRLGMLPDKLGVQPELIHSSLAFLDENNQS